MVASLQEVESWWQQKGVRVVSRAPSVSQSKSDSMRVTRTQMWMDLSGVGVDQNKIDEKPNAYLLELWKQ